MTKPKKCPKCDGDLTPVNELVLLIEGCPWCQNKTWHPDRHDVKNRLPGRQFKVDITKLRVDKREEVLDEIVKLTTQQWTRHGPELLAQIFNRVQVL